MEVILTAELVPTSNSQLTAEAAPHIDKQLVAQTVTEMLVGDNGATFVPDVSPAGDISWTNDARLPNPTPRNIKGGDGLTPKKGVDYFTPPEKTELKNDILKELPLSGNEISNQDIFDILSK